jgi:hypothetical protein
MTDELDRIFAIVTAVLVVIEYGVLVVAEVRSSLRIERQCRQLAKEVCELWVEV